MDRSAIIARTAEYIRGKFSGEATGHDWFHIHRVRQNALLIGQKEGADLFVVELAALLHDIADFKFEENDEEAGPRAAREWLSSLGVAQEIITQIEDIIRTMSFKGLKDIQPMKTLAGKVVQDADRLEAIGAIGIARTFAYGGKKGSVLYDPEVPPHAEQNTEEYTKKSRGQNPSLNHFYEKMLHVKELMNTAAAKEIAGERHAFVELFLKRFLTEWDGKRYSQ